MIDHDLRRMIDLINTKYDDPSDEGLPSDLLSGLGELVPCDSVLFFEFNPGERRCRGDGCSHAPQLAALFWKYFWKSPCSYPERSGDYRSTIKTSDFCSERQWRSSPMYSEYLRLFGAGHELITCVDVYSGRSLRLVLRRQRGDFSERDRDVVSLLRPHLASIYRDLRRRRSGSPNLTIRQWEVMHLVADGASNAEIAKRLCLSEGTVHKHLENIFGRLSVTSRTAAVALVMPDLPRY